MERTKKQQKERRREQVVKYNQEARKRKKEKKLKELRVYVPEALHSPALELVKKFIKEVDNDNALS